MFEQLRAGAELNLNNYLLTFTIRLQKVGRASKLLRVTHAPTWTL